MNTSFPLSKYKIILLLSIFVFLMIFFVYNNGITSDSLKTKENLTKTFVYNTNSTLIEAILNYNNNNKQVTETVNLNQKRLFCMILTTPKNFNEKAVIINKTWAKDCDKYFFVTKMNNNLSTNSSYEYFDPFPILQPAYHDVEVYGKLTDKVYKMFREVYKRYSDYDWYLKADDDTFIFAENLVNFLKLKNSSSPVTYGFDFKVIVDRGYHSGGAGYVLSNEALKRIGPKLEPGDQFCPNTGTEDVDFAKCLRKLGVYPDKSIDELGRERFHPFDVGTHLMGGFPDWYLQYASNPVKKGIESCSDTSISFHYMSPSQIEKLYTLYSSFKKSQQPFNLTNLLYQMLI